MSEQVIPLDLQEIGSAVWIEALKNGTPDAGSIIAKAILAERERCAVCIESRADETSMGGEVWVLVGLADEIRAGA